jgi:hypothetical protein
MLKADSREAIERLCEAGCDPKVLLEYFSWLATCFMTFVIPAVDPVTGERVRQRDIQIGPRDSLKHLLDGMDIEKLDDIKDQTENFIALVARVWRTPFAELVRADDRLPPHGVIGSPVPVVQSVLADLLAIPGLAREYGPGKHRAYARILENVYRFIESNTGRWHDPEMVPILCDITPYKPTVDHLKNWRSEHHLTRSKGNSSSR